LSVVKAREACKRQATENVLKRPAKVIRTAVHEQDTDDDNEITDIFATHMNLETLCEADVVLMLTVCFHLLFYMMYNYHTVRFCNKIFCALSYNYFVRFRV